MYRHKAQNPRTCHIYANIFVKNMREAFAALQKLLSFFQQNISVYLVYKVIKDLTSWPLNKLVKLTMLLTTGPRVTDEEMVW